MVVRDGQSHVRSKSAVFSGVFVRAGNHHIPAAAQERFKHHLPRFLFACVHFPCLEQHFIVDKPPSQFHRKRHRGNAKIIRHRVPFLPHHFLVIPEPEVSHPQNTPADFIDSIYKAQHASGAEYHPVFFFIRNEQEALIIKYSLLKMQFCPGFFCFFTCFLDISPQNVQCTLNSSRRNP